MTDIYQEEKGSRKKFLVPLVVLLLCGVALTGAAYAYNATVENNENSIDIQALSMTLNGDNGILTTPMIDLDVVVASHTVDGKAVFKDGETIKMLKADGTSASSEDDAGKGYYMQVVVKNGSKDVTGTKTTVASYELTVTNKNDVAVTITPSAVKNGSTATLGGKVTGVDALYIQIANGADDVAYIDIVTDGKSENSNKHTDSTLEPVAAGATVTYTVSVICTTADYFDADATQPATTNFGFQVNFVATPASS